jgi:arylsulfatase A-like enzyme
VTNRKSFLTLFLINFVFFSLLFIKDAFYQWDGYAFYMRLSDFLPEAALSFCLWSLLVIPVWLICCLITYILSKVLAVLQIKKHLQYSMLLSIGIVIPFIYKRIFLSNISISNIIGIDREFILLLVVFLSIFFVLIFRKLAITSDKVLFVIHQRMMPLFVIFSSLLIIAVLLSIFSRFGNKSSFVSSSEKVKHDYSQSTRLPNIILIVMDTLSAQDMQTYGYERPTTPFISKWSQGGIKFLRAYSPSNWTTPSTMSILTGQYPWTHGVWYRAKYKPVTDYIYNVVNLLRERGYTTYSFVQNHYAHPDILGLGNYFDVKEKDVNLKIPKKWWFDRLSSYYEDHPVVQDWIFKNNGIVQNIINDFSPDIDFSLVPPEIVYDKFLKALSARERYPGRPFFAWLQLYPPHEPYLPSKNYFGLFGDADKYASHKAQYGSFNFHQEYEKDRQSEVNILRKRYDEFIAYSDDAFNKFVSRLEKTVDMTNTIIILTSDHGESFTHGFLGHNGKHLYEDLVHIPLIVKLPSYDGKRVIDYPVSLVDIAPTILEFAGIKAPAWIEGRSLVPFFTGSDEGYERELFSMQLINNSVFGEFIKNGTIAIWHSNLKLIYYLNEKRYLLFDIKSDPEEKYNIGDTDVALANRLIKVIEKKLMDINSSK